ncbi:MAG: sulfocyanin-like copper-binding protein [Gemmatimonadales bacterium]
MNRRGTILGAAAVVVALVVALAVGLAAMKTRAVRAPAADEYAKWDAKTNTATLELVAGPFIFNDASQGPAGFTIPGNANVVINFVNKDGTPHSAEVISGEEPIPNQAVDPAIPRAYTKKLQEGMAQEDTDVMTFTVPDSGRYRIICGVPGHAISGMWLWLVVDPAAKTTTFGAMGN